VKKRALHFCLKYGLGFALLAWVIAANWTTTTSEGEEIGIASALQMPIDVWCLVLAIFISLATAVLSILRWFLLARALWIPLDIGSALRAGFIGAYFNNVLPGVVSGDVVKGALLVREHGRMSDVAATVLADRAIGLLALCLFVAVLGVGDWFLGVPLHILASPANAVLQILVIGACAAALGSLLGWALLSLMKPRAKRAFATSLSKLPAVGRTAARLWWACRVYHRRVGIVLLALTLSMIGHAATAFGYYFAARVFFRGESAPPLGTHILVIPFGLMIKAGFPTPGGMGGAEFVFGKLYALCGFPFTIGVLASFIMRLISCFVSLAGYLLSVQNKHGSIGLTQTVEGGSKRRRRARVRAVENGGAQEVHL
jgi:uncharacterized membrane protein YbhN (UPF0104 family)